jgi:two-component system NtrC family sensor kinase
MPDVSSRALAGDTHARPTVAGWSSRLSLRLRLLVIVGAVVAAVVSAVSFLEVRSFESTIESTLLDAARQTALAVASDLKGRPAVLDPVEIDDTLREFTEADPLVHSITAVQFSDQGEHDIIASTLSAEREEALALARRAIDTHELALDRGEVFASCAVPVEGRTPATAAVATVSLASVAQVRERGRRIALGSAVPIIVLVTLLVDVATRAFVYRPVTEIRATMQAAAGGALGSRARVLREDELGAVAVGLNDMLARLETFNASLQERVREATAELRVRNSQLEESYGQLLTLREALARAERLAALGQMAANVAHQAGTPLNLVSGYVQMIRQDPSADALVRQRLDIVDTQIQQVTRVLRSMLDQARQPLVREPTPLSTIIGRVCELAAPRLTAARVQTTIDVPASLPPVDIDVVQFELALLALISNALDAMPGGGTIAIRAELDERGPEEAVVRIEVRDTGTGIEAALLDRLFDLGTTTKPAGHGTGLGLGIVRGVIRQHGGTITARNPSEGGAAFVIELPIGARLADGPVPRRT